MSYVISRVQLMMTSLECLLSLVEIHNEQVTRNGCSFKVVSKVILRNSTVFAFLSKSGQFHLFKIIYGPFSRPTYKHRGFKNYANRF